MQDSWRRWSNTLSVIGRKTARRQAVDTWNEEGIVHIDGEMAI